jgi:hypothetical protein
LLTVPFKKELKFNPESEFLMAGKIKVLDVTESWLLIAFSWMPEPWEESDLK